jgi:hypothetical protein
LAALHREVFCDSPTVRVRDRDHRVDRDVRYQLTFLVTTQWHYALPALYLRQFQGIRVRMRANPFYAANFDDALGHERFPSCALRCAPLKQRGRSGAKCGSAYV